MPTPLPLLESLAIAAPCPTSWDQMEGDDRVRFCSHCQQAVYDVSALTLGRGQCPDHQDDRPAVPGLFRRADGTVMTRDCPVGVRRAARRRLAAVIGGWAFLFLVALAGFTSGRGGPGGAGPGAGTEELGQSPAAVRDRGRVPVMGAPAVNPDGGKYP